MTKEIHRIREECASHLKQDAMKIGSVIATASIVFVILMAQAAAAEHVADGEAEPGVATAGANLAARGVKVPGRFPPGPQDTFVFTAGVGAAAKVAEAAKAQVEPVQAGGAPALKSYADVRALLNDFMKRNRGPIEFAPHGAFWNEMSYKQFIEGNLPEVSDRETGKPLKILVVRNAKGSNIIMALGGTKGSIFDEETGSFGRMPPIGSFMSDEDINRLADWIDRGCPDEP